MRTTRPAASVLAGSALLVLAGCSTAPAAPGNAPFGTGGASARTIQVVAAENFWGSIAVQLGGERVTVTNIIDSPDVDPHDYEAKAADARAIAAADLVLINGVGYDTWATQAVRANPAPGRTVLTVGDVVGVPAGGNPHRWYNPDDVQKVVAALVADYKMIDPAHSAYFDQRKVAFTTIGLAAYRVVIAEIRAKYAGTPVGASESIFAMVAPSLGLDLITPPTFLTAVSQGTDPTAADKATIDAQIRDRKLAVYVCNSQNATPDVQAQITAAKAHGIPVTTITETLTPPTASWQEWQTAQLTALREALAKATGRR
ncbi:MAG TPA: zinc ABC transporter substrate-binding protein [Mycobacteriales bacterium]|nr:zinc ABC transporter substrate-binding protein [Mycobacteriales bacterium]